MPRRIVSKKVLKKFFLNEARKINKSKAKNRKALRKILKEKDPYVYTQTEEKHFFKKKHLEKIKEVTPSFRDKKLKLPIFIYDDSRSRGKCYVEGDLEAEVVKKFGDLTPYKVRENRLWMSKPIAHKLNHDYWDIFQLIFLP